MLFRSIATVLGLPLGTLIADLWNWQAAFIMVAGVTAISTVLAAILVPRKLTIPASGIRDQLTLLRDKNIWLGIGFVTCAAATLYGYYTYIRPLIRQTLGFSTTMLSVILMLLGGIDVISSLLSGRLGAKMECDGSTVFTSPFSSCSHFSVPPCGHRRLGSWCSACWDC